MPLPLIALGPTLLNLQQNIDTGKIGGFTDDSHWCILQHIWDDKKSDHTPSDIHLVQLRNTAISPGNSDVFQ
jgi:hypothetical protein